MPATLPAIDPSAVAAYREALVPWYRANARDLPWRRDRDPWRVWVSEIMLQQTRVEAVIPYYERFLARFPTPAALAAAPEEDVLAAWSGLGYYRRARLLREGARHVVDVHGGAFPAGERDALAVPGVGRYTAGAIRSIALGIRAPVLDGNVMRVVARVFGVRGNVATSAVAKRLWAIASEAVAAGDPSEVNQAQMEIGALVCTPRDPACAACPLAGLCTARREGAQGELPERPAARASVEVRRTVLLVRDGDRVLLRRRLPDEPSPGLWDLPGAFEGNDSVAATDIADAASRLPFAIETGETLGTLRHAVTHRRIALEIVEAVPAPGARTAGGARAATRGCDGADLAWRTPASALETALASPARRVLARWG